MSHLGDLPIRAWEGWFSGQHNRVAEGMEGGFDAAIETLNTYRGLDAHTIFSLGTGLSPLSNIFRPRGSTVVKVSTILV